MRNGRVKKVSKPFLRVLNPKCASWPKFDPKVFTKLHKWTFRNTKIKNLPVSDGAHPPQTPPFSRTTSLGANHHKNCFATFLRHYGRCTKQIPINIIICGPPSSYYYTTHLWKNKLSRSNNEKKIVSPQLPSPPPLSNGASLTIRRERTS